MKQKLKKIETKIRESKVLRRIIGAVLIIPATILIIAAIIEFGFIVWDSKGLILVVAVVGIAIMLGVIVMFGYGYDLIFMHPIKKTNLQSNIKKKGKPNKNVGKK